MKKLSHLKIPADFKQESIKTIAKINEKAVYRIGSVYGALPKISSSARPAHLLPNPSRQEFERYLSGLREIDVDFHYVLNDPRETYDDILDALLSLGVKSLVVHLGVAKDFFKYFDTTVSAVEGICRREQITRIKKHKRIRGLCLHEKINRNPSIIKQLKTEFNDINFEIVANNFCLLDCPNRKNHYRIISSGGKNSDLYSVGCVERRIKDPSLFLSSPWVPPICFHHYQQSVSCFKISGREFFSKESYQYIKAMSCGINPRYLQEFIFLSGETSFSPILNRVNFNFLSCELDRAMEETSFLCSKANCSFCRICEFKDSECG